ncbi:glycosyltransferase family 2 protein [Candidatus Micrarchaeota archaeon]|nr:glycosyltransferase family 2 protein [Candidatus Micrarchaeota archaeon]
MNMLSVVIPAYRKEHSIRLVLKEASDTLKAFEMPYEIIVVDDGSPDNTLAEAKKHAKKHPNIRVVSYEKNKGKGNALMHGFNFTRGDLVAFLDADLDLHPKQLRVFMNLMDALNADVIIGSKRHSLSKVNYPATRKALSRCYQLLTRLLFGLPLTDTQTGIKLFKRRVLEDSLPLLLVKQYAFDLELLAVAHHKGYRIAEGPVEMSYTQFGSTVNPRAVFNMFLDTCAVFYRMHILKYYDRLQGDVGRISE